ncbi:hypothetical protein K3495_g10126 [Podosphaera aphanis]|nr:hypothetical protein K3495_g10126 [Podosphaera aphanis]
MVDTAARPEQGSDNEGASMGEQLIEAARRNNIQLLQEIIDQVPDTEKLASLLNDTKTVLGNHIYHEAALQGNYEVIDLLLDQEGFECDPINRSEGDTPLHCAIRYINRLPLPHTPEITKFARDLISMMMEAGSDPRVKNNAKLTPAQLVDPHNRELRQLIQDFIDVEQNKGDYIIEEEKSGAENEGDAGSASDSDS